MNDTTYHANTTVYVIRVTGASTAIRSTKKQRAVKKADSLANETGKTVTVHTLSAFQHGRKALYIATPDTPEVPAPAPATSAVVDTPVAEKPQPVKKPAKPVAITRPIPTPADVKKVKEYNAKYVGKGNDWTPPVNFEKRGFIRRPLLDIESPVAGWGVLYTTPKKNEYLLRALDRSEYAFYCTVPGHDVLRPLNNQAETKTVGRTAWCDKCGVKKARKANLANV